MSPYLFLLVLLHKHVLCNNLACINCVIFQIFELVASGEPTLQRDIKETLKVELGVLMETIYRSVR